MSLYGTIWNGDSWATEGGRVKINWMYAPFTASYTDFSFDACSGGATSTCASTRWWNQGSYMALNANQISQLKWVRENWMIYDYCWDKTRYNVTPTECFYITTTATLPESPLAPTSSPSSSPSSSDGSPNTIGTMPPNFSNLPPTTTNSLNDLSSSKLQVSMSPCYLPVRLIVILFVFQHLFNYSHSTTILQSHV